jgi:hypothetical protein
MGRGERCLAFLDRKSSPDPCIHIFDSEGDAEKATLRLDRVYPHGYTMDFSSLMILLLMESENEWLPLFSQYGIEPDNASPDLLSRPCCNPALCSWDKISLDSLLSL